MILVFIGIQWSWKWTQARLLAEKFDFKILEMWQELRNIIASWSPLWNEIKETMNAWKLLGPEIVWEVAKKSIWDQINMDLILDWYLRNLWNKMTLDEIVPNYKVVYFDLSREKAMNRLLWRMYDPETWDTFPSWTETNPKNWNKLIKRDDDTEAGIKTRIDAFFETTEPIVDLLRDEWKVVEINADQSVVDVNEELIKKLWL